MRDQTRDLEQLARLADPGAAAADILEHALGALSEVVPYDLAAVLRLDEDRLKVAAATGRLADERVRAHELDLQRFPTLRRTLEHRRPVPLDAHHHASAEGDPYDGVLDLPHGHSCMVIPLFARDRTLGAITLDRSVCAPYEASTVRIAALYGELVSLALTLFEDRGLLERDRARLVERNRLLGLEIHGLQDSCRLLEASESPAMQRLVQLVRQAAPSRLPILIRGETGTGKEVVSRAIHAWSDRAHGPFVKLNCAAIPENLVESELFGHVEGAFTGADRDRPGRFSTANGGTLLLDEIGELPLQAQAKLLRVLQEGVFEPVGADEPHKVDVRVLAATHVDLERAVQDKRFREDLWYRLAVFPVQVPALRDRPEDAVRIARGLLDEFEREGRGGPWSLPDDAAAAIAAAPWPGNVRELRNVLERATVLQRSGGLAVDLFGLSPAAASAPARPRAAPLPSFAANERAYLEAALDQAQGKLYGPDGAAALAGLKPSTLRSKLVKHGLR